MRELKIDEELRDLLPPLTDDEYKKLEKNIVEKGFDVNCPIMEWNGCIADGHNRYSICKKHNIEFVTAKLAYKTKEEVMKWMLDIQLGRRNLSPIQRIAVAEKYRPIYEKQAKENLKTPTGGKKSLTLPKLVKSSIDTSEKLAKIAGVSKETYRMGAKILNSDNEKVKQDVLSGVTKISAGYKEIIKPKENIETNTIHTNMQNDYKEDDTVDLPQDNIKEIIADMKIPKNADDYWNFLNEIECIEENFKEPIEVAFDVLFERHNINGQITLEERNIAVNCISDLIEKMETLKEKIKNTKLKGEK